MEILISFTTSVGVTQAIKALKNVAVDIVNQSIVLSVKNKKIPINTRIETLLNSREINRKLPPFSSLVINDDETVRFERCYDAFMSIYYYDAWGSVYRLAEFSNYRKGRNYEDYYGSITESVRSQFGKPTPLGGFTSTSYSQAQSSGSFNVRSTFQDGSDWVDEPYYSRIESSYIEFIRGTDGADW